MFSFGFLLREGGADLEVPSGGLPKCREDPPHVTHYLGPWVSLAMISSQVGPTFPMPGAHRCRRFSEIRLLFRP